jgi:hypothetical protein
MSNKSDDNKGRTRAGRENGPEHQQNPVPLGINYLLAIGIDKYAHIPKLYNAVKDAKDVAQLLIDKYQFTKENTTYLFNEEATQDKIMDALRNLATKVTDKDTVVIYFSGHGEYDKLIDIGYWIPVDGEMSKSGSFISFHFIKSVVNAIKSHHTFIIADSCYSGSFFTDRSSKRVQNRLERRASRWLLTAGRNEVVSDGKPGDNSPFADAVLYYLKNNDEPRLRVSRFCNDVIDNVGENHDQLPRAASLKGVGDRGGEFMFRLKAYKDHVFEEGEIEADESQKRGEIETPVTEEPTEPIKEHKELVERKPKKEEPMRNIDDLKQRLKNYIIGDRFKDAFELFHEVMITDSNLENRIIMQQARFSPIQRDFDDGVLSQSDYNMTKARIRKAILGIIRDLEEEEIKTDIFQTVAATRSTGTATALSDLERQGLESEAQLLQEKINFFKQQMAIMTDISQKFTAQKQLEGFEKELAAIKAKLGI